MLPFRNDLNRNLFNSFTNFDKANHHYISVEQAIKLIGNHFSSSRKVLITTHSNPDGDALGSSLAWYFYLKHLGHEVWIAVPNDYPSFLNWLPGVNEVLVFKHNEKKVLDVINKVDTVCCLDFNSLDRIDNLSKHFSSKNWTRILIDHHPMPEANAFDIILSTVNTSSTSEIVYDLITGISGKAFISRSMAECLYAGIITDTGSFSYSCNFKRTYLTIAHIISLGIDGEKIHRLIYDTYSESRMRLLGHSLSERLVVLNDFHTAYIYLTKNDLQAFNHKIGDTEGLVNYALSINGIVFAVLFTEKENHIRMSFRSKGVFSVNEFVRNHFEGGGHRNAAGGNSYDSMSVTLEKFEALLPAYQVELSANAILHNSL